MLNPSTLVDNVHLGVAPTWGDAALGIAVGMIAYTGIETISNMAEEARDAERTVPRGTAAGGARGARPLRAAADHRPVGDAGDPGRRRPLLDRAGDDVRRRPGARDRREPGARRGPHGRAADLRRGPGGGDPADRHQRGADRRLAADLLDGPLPPAPRAAAPGPSALQHPLRRDPRLLRGRRADHGAGQDRFPGDACTRSARCSRSRSRTSRCCDYGSASRTSKRGWKPPLELPLSGRGAAADGGPRRPGHVLGLDRGDGAQPAHAGRRRGLDAARDRGLLLLPAPLRAAAGRRR